MVVAVPPLKVTPLADPDPPLLNVRLVFRLTLMLAEPLNPTPLIVRDVANTVAVAAFPPMSPVTLAPERLVSHAGSAYELLVYTPLVTVPALPVMLTAYVAAASTQEDPFHRCHLVAALLKRSALVGTFIGAV
jgi:hypothetical protein